MTRNNQYDGGGDSGSEVDIQVETGAAERLTGIQRGYGGSWAVTAPSMYHCFPYLCFFYQELGCHLPTYMEGPKGALLPSNNSSITHIMGTTGYQCEKGYFQCFGDLRPKGVVFSCVWLYLRERYYLHWRLRYCVCFPHDALKCGRNVSMSLVRM